MAFRLDYAAHDVLNLGDVEVRWVTPVVNESNRQHAQILAQYNDAPNDRDGTTMSVGGLVVGTAAWYPDAPYDVHDDIAMRE